MEYKKEEKYALVFYFDPGTVICLRFTNDDVARSEWAAPLSYSEDVVNEVDIVKMTLLAQTEINTV